VSDRITAIFGKDDQWLYDSITKLVETKKAAGFNTSYSFELVRLAKKGLVSVLDHTKDEDVDRLIMKGHDVTDPSKPT